MMTSYEAWYGGLGGYSRAESRNCEFGWAAWYLAAAEGLW